MATMGHAAGIRAFGIVLLCITAGPAYAFLPMNCSRKHAKDDFQKSELVVIGRVTTIQRFRFLPEADAPASAKDLKMFFYLATVTVGQTIRGTAKPGDDIFFFTGSYESRRDDETMPAVVRVANAHPGWALDYNHVYLLALKPAGRLEDLKAEGRRDGKWILIGPDKRQIWEPRSCHWSIHEITVRHRTETVKAEDGLTWLQLVPKTYATLYFDRYITRSPDEKRILLDEFIAAQNKGEFPEAKSQSTGP